MYWKVDVLTAKQAEITRNFEGTKEDIKNQAIVDGFEIIRIVPDYVTLIKSKFQYHHLSSIQLHVFFKDFGDMQKCGLSVTDALTTLTSTTSIFILKEAIKKIVNFVNDGRSLEESFENTKIFPKIVCVSLAAAERTGNIPELLNILSEYYRVKHENQSRIIRSMIYPAIILCLLTGLSIFISLKLVPLLKAFLPKGSHSLSADILLGYSAFIRDYWWVVLAGIVAVGFGLKYLWEHYSEKMMEYIFKVPLIGDLIKNIELAHVFHNLYVYSRSGVNIIQTITNIHQANKTYVTEKLIVIQDRIFKGSTLDEAFKSDKFFSDFITQNLKVGQTTGNFADIFERIYKYYDIKTKESISAMISMVEPALLVFAAMFLLMILCTFILPLYTNISQMGEGIFK